MVDTYVYGSQRSVVCSIRIGRKVDGEESRSGLRTGKRRERKRYAGEGMWGGRREIIEGANTQMEVVFVEAVINEEQTKATRANGHNLEQTQLTVLLTNTHLSVPSTTPTLTILLLVNTPILSSSLPRALSTCATTIG